MKAVLDTLNKDRDISLSIIATGMHLSEAYGLTVNEISVAELPIEAVVQVDVSETSGAVMAQNIGHMLIGFVEALQQISPDVVLVLGDRGEMLAGALAAIHLNIPVAHIHGGERSGTVDESIRHAISKLAHFHLTATQEAHDRLVRMGERPHNIHVTGAPGVAGILKLANGSRTELAVSVGFDPARPIALMIFHPVLQEAEVATEGAIAILEGLHAYQAQILAVMPNSDAGGNEIRRVLSCYETEPDTRVVKHLTRDKFVSWMAIADVMIGNSSSGIIEAASFGTPVINVGSRQNLRERNENVTDVEVNKQAINCAIQKALKNGRFPPKNTYGNDETTARIVHVLKTLELNSSVLMKANVY
jgi:GDP/UDP-N,N'-diacetylbacillosamine 2-epimerase (hydrolysing)